MIAVILLSRGGYGRPPREDLDKIVEQVPVLLDGDQPTFVFGAFVDRGEPSLPVALQECAERGARQIAILPLFLPSDRNQQRWLEKVMIRWHSEWEGGEVVLQMLPSLAESNVMAEAVTAALRLNLDRAADLLESPPKNWEKNPEGWSYPPPHRYHLLLCQGPRCTANGATERWQQLSQKLREKKLFERENGALSVMTGCLFPCNHAPVMVVHPDNAWYSAATPEAVDSIVEQHIENGEVAQEHIIQP